MYIGHSLDPMFVLKIPQDKFERVNQLIADQSPEVTDEKDEDYYLHDMTDRELLEILKNPNDWSPFDIGYAKELLVARGVIGEDYKIKYGSADQYVPEKLQTSWIVVGYLLGLLSLLGIFMGLSIINAKKTLPNGHVVKIYDEATRKHGTIMAIIGTITLLGFLIRIISLRN